MRIASVEAHPVRQPVCTALVKVTLEDGAAGWGESSAPAAPEIVCTIIDSLLKPVLCDLEFDGSLACIERLWAGMYSQMRNHGHTGGFMLDAIAGVDIALWDLAGKLAGKSISYLLGATKSSVPVYSTTEDFRVVKLSHTGGERELLDRIDGLQGRCDVAVDGLWRFEPGSAAAFGRELDARNAVWFANPLPPEDPRAHAAIARRFRTPVALGECYRTHFELAPFFREGAMKILQPDIGRTGITEGLRIAKEAAKYGVSVIPSVSAGLGPKLAASIHFAAAVGCNLVEYDPGAIPMASEYLREPVQMQKTRYVVPRGPGLGAELANMSSIFPKK